MRSSNHALHNLVHTHEPALAQKHLESLPYKDLLGDLLLFASNDLSHRWLNSLFERVSHRCLPP